MQGKLSMEALREAIAESLVDTVIAAQVDMQGRLMGKRFHARHFVEEAWAETHSCNYLLATDMEMHTVPGYKATSWAAGYGDYVMKPDLSTLRLAPWLEATALVLCDVLDHHTHEDVPHSPRAALKRQIARLEAMGLQAMVATELEFFLFRQSYEDLADAEYRSLTPISPYNEDYHIFQTTKEEDVMRAIRNGVASAGIPVESSKGEADAGQEEVNIRYADALTMADHHSILKNAVKEIAWGKGRAATFMAKWGAGAAGSSSHIHQSLRRIADGSPAFYDANGQHGMSRMAEQYLAGLLAHARETTLFLAPYVNSYKRFAAETFAPVSTVWSVDNRTAGHRLVAAGAESVRIENRIGGADLNPYLAIASQLAAGMAGIEAGLDLEPAFEGDAYGVDEGRLIPRTLREAIAAAENSAMLRAAFGPEVLEHYLHAARWEQAQFDRAVTDYEVRRGFERA